MITLSRRQAIKLGFTGLGYAGLGFGFAPVGMAGQTLGHGASPLGILAYPPDFDHFVHRNP
jgi:hypothetical protein